MTVPSDGKRVDPNELFAQLEKDRASGALSANVTTAEVWYEPNKSAPGLVDRVHADGSRETGQFVNGEFHVTATASDGS